MNLLDELLLDFFINLPALITLLVAIVVTMLSWQRHPPAARWALLGFGWLFVTYLLTIFWRTVGIFLFLAQPQPQDPELILSLLVLSLCESLAYIFLSIAFFIARTPFRHRHYYEDAENDLPQQYR